jgi:hypothetical protein
MPQRTGIAQACRHVSAVMAVPMLWSAALQSIGITGTSPVMTWRR